MAGECYARCVDADVYWLDVVRDVLQGGCTTDTSANDASVVDTFSGYRMLCGILRYTAVW